MITLVRRIPELKKKIKQARQRRKVIGFVPTMGAFHEGHLSLMRRARRETDFLVISIFVNPLQFDPKEDLQRYPRQLKQDIALAKTAGVDLIFYPTSRQMYPTGQETVLDIPSLTDHLCGRSRPTHFPGVLTVVNKLFNLVEPDISYFGQKDYQQALLIKKMAVDLNMNLKIKICPIVRERDGLALSSRNRYLSPSQRRTAPCLYRALCQARQLIKKDERSIPQIIRKMRSIINAEKKTRIDYLTIVNPSTLTDLKRITRRPVLIALAVYVGRTRLIDNILI